jgi:hypothetical protein
MPTSIAAVVAAGIHWSDTNYAQKRSQYQDSFQYAHLSSFML